jgi:dGTPase
MSSSKDNEELRSERIHSNSDPDNRTIFQKDRDRILYTPAFRRLGGVAQVVHVNTDRGYHNRLTHSLKVAQVGRRLAEHLRNETEQQVITTAGGLDPDVVETACLAHDLGHPPFGHAAERALQDRLDNQGLISSFEGNPQSFRIVNNVSINKRWYGDHHRGLDLTLASLNAMLKYPWDRGTASKEKEKWGYYPTEEPEFEQTRRLRTPGDSDDDVSLEAKIMDWADDLTYAIHDLVDFYEAGLLPLNRLVQDPEERERVADEFESNTDTDTGSWDATGFLADSLPDLAAVAGGEVGKQAPDRNPLEYPFDGSSYDHAGVSFMSSELVERYLGVVSGMSVSVDPETRGGLNITDELRYEVHLLQYLTEHYVFNDPALLAQQRGHKEAVETLFDELYEATAEDSDRTGMIPAPFDEKVEQIHDNNLGYDGFESDTLRARVTADIIASMTEKQAMQLHERLVGSTPGLVIDQIV